ncbi:HAD-IA family hydrolase [Clostridium sp. YIM B02515]|uniref:HAD-IA family hydrolase n=1 Tax=Clostridium rhizosphaerae TaxID=2803861 RepID=A0ABS1T4S4_9CLOT|nr:HAD-IA family hydrolase [Clostridium rhizosphaerae]MBL4934336.1 HAD-IA family hydrolase [Clostridium rhizosphaerae]
MKQKINNNKIKAILIDSGKVLNGPITGHWFITPNFFSYVDENIFKAIDTKQRNAAFNKASDYISKQSLIITEEEEFLHFYEYYKIFSSELPELKLKDNQIRAIAEDLVYNYSKYQFYKDSIEVIPELSKKYKLAIVSDAWPSLENVFKRVGMREYFSSFIISSIKGITKPNELMYKAAIEELEILPEEAIFIDDSIKNCDGAAKLGIKSVLMCRDLKSYLYNRLTCKSHRVIRDFNEFKRILS